MKHERWIKEKHWVESIVDGVFLGIVQPRTRSLSIRLEQAFATPDLAEKAANEHAATMVSEKWRRTKPDPACAAKNFDGAAFQTLLSTLESLLPKGVRTEGAAKSLAKLSKLGETQPSLLRFYAWCEAPNKLFAEMLLRDWYSLDEVIEETTHLRKAFQLDTTLTPIGRDTYGFHVCVQRYSGKVLLWEHETRTLKRLTNGFPELLAKLKTPLTRAASKRMKSEAITTKESSQKTPKSSNTARR